MSRVLFVCSGNICRSPMAEAVLAHKLTQRGFDPTDLVDSAGIGSWHVGDAPDPRTRTELTENSIPWLSKARQVRTQDFADFDHLIAMDRENKQDLLDWPGANSKKISLLMDWCGQEDTDVPDPYHGGKGHFARVYEMCDQACDAIALQLFPI